MPSLSPPPDAAEPPQQVTERLLYPCASLAHTIPWSGSRSEPRGAIAVWSNSPGRPSRLPSSRVHFGHHASGVDRVWSTMVAALYLAIAAAALLWRPASGHLAQSTTTISDFVCRSTARYFNVTADYRIWRSTRVRLASSDFKGECVLSVLFTTSSQKLQPWLLPQLLLVKIEHLQLAQSVDWFYANAASGRTPSHWIATYCCPTYVWSSESVQLYMYIVNNMMRLNVSYQAAFFVTEATNVCSADGNGELLLPSGDSVEYAFASDYRINLVRPNNASCTPGVWYALTLRPSVSSDLLNVTVLSCPRNDSCGSLELNGVNCINMTVMSAPPGSSITLRYVLRDCKHAGNKPTGFVVSARVASSAETPSALHVVAASVAAALTAALVIGVTVALLRRRRKRLFGRKSPSSAAVQHPQRLASVGDVGDEEIAMVGNDLYGVTLAYKTTADQ